MSRTLLRPGEPEDRKPRIVERQAGAASNTMPVPRSLHLVTAEEGLGKTILLAYGGEPARRMMAAIMIRQGYCVISCGDGDAALRHLRSVRVQLVITGMVMPNMDGLELIRRLQGQHAHLPILALADEADPMSRIYLRYAGLAGARGVQTIPATRERFLGMIGDILAGATHAIRSAV